MSVNSIGHLAYLQQPPTKEQKDEHWSHPVVYTKIRLLSTFCQDMHTTVMCW